MKTNMKTLGDWGLKKESKRKLAIWSNMDGYVNPFFLPPGNTRFVHRNHLLRCLWATFQWVKFHPHPMDTDYPCMDFLRECWTTLFGAAKISDDLRSEPKTPTLGSQLSESSRNSRQIAGPRQRYVRFLCQGVLKKIETSSSRFP